MKCIVLHGQSAAEAWDLGLFQHAQVIESLDLSECTAQTVGVRAFPSIFPNLTRPLHIAVPERRLRRWNSACISHLLTRPLPRNSFFKLGESVFAETPYLFFAIACGSMPFAQACLLGMELCGQYSTLPAHQKAHRTSTDKGYLERNAPTTATILARYVEALGMGRKSVASRACKVIANGSRSPRESIFHLMMRIQRRQGGYGFTGYLINYRIPLPPELAALIGAETLQVDFFWKDFHLAVEYDGSDSHSSEWQRSYDNVRRSVLRQMGIQVVTIDKRQMADMAVLDGIMQMVSQTINGPEVLQDAKSRERRANLHAQLLEPDINLYQ